MNEKLKEIQEIMKEMISLSDDLAERISNLEGDEITSTMDSSEHNRKSISLWYKIEGLVSEEDSKEEEE
jgi:DNA-binding ferritin-like protein